MIQIWNMSFRLCAKDYSQQNLFQMIKTWKFDIQLNISYLHYS